MHLYASANHLRNLYIVDVDDINWLDFEIYHLF